MAQPNTRMLFVNLPVRDLQRAKEFFTQLGFEYNPKFTDDKAACMIISSAASVMLLTKEYFETFIKKPVSDASKQTEAMFALSCQSRAEVDDMVKKALAAGGKPALDPVDHGFMYGWSFHDLDGHHWEVVWMDPAAVG